VDTRAKNAVSRRDGPGISRAKGSSAVGDAVFRSNQLNIEKDRVDFIEKHKGADQLVFDITGQIPLEAIYKAPHSGLLEPKIIHRRVAPSGASSGDEWILE
jgi:hypothetical protein